MGGKTNGPFLRWVDAGDAAGFDWGVGDLTTDGAWHDLDLTAKGVPVSAKLVLLAARFGDDAIPCSLDFRTNGNVNTFNMSTITAVVAGQTHTTDMLVAPDEGGVIEYRATNTTITTANITIKGWFV